MQADVQGVHVGNNKNNNNNNNNSNNNNSSNNNKVVGGRIPFASLLCPLFMPRPTRRS